MSTSSRRIAGEQRAIDVDDPLHLVRISDDHRSDLDARSEPSGDRRGVFVEQLDHAAADVAESEQCNSDRPSHAVRACVSRGAWHGRTRLGPQNARMRGRRLR
jgi:hypothetical protein